MDKLTGKKAFSTPFEFSIAWAVTPSDSCVQITLTGPSGSKEHALTPEQSILSFELTGKPSEAGETPPTVQGVLSLTVRPKFTALEASVKVNPHEAFVGQLSSWSTSGEGSVRFEPPEEEAAEPDDEEEADDKSEQRRRARKQRSRK